MDVVASRRRRHHYFMDRARSCGARVGSGRRDARVGLSSTDTGSGSARRGAGWDEGKTGGCAALDEAPEGVGVQVLLDEVAEQVERAFPGCGEAGARRDPEPGTPCQPGGLGEEPAAEP